MNATVLLTGATGFVGTAVVKRLCERSADVHALVRRSSDREPLANCSVTYHLGDLCDGDSIESFVAAGVAAGRAAGRPVHLIHSGALISYRTRDRARQQAINTGGTRSVLAAARRHGVDRLLHVSSIVGVAHSPSGETHDETASWNLGELGNDYADTKHAAEELAREAAADLDVVIVNPGAIFGPAPGRSNTVEFLRRVAAGRLGPLAPPASLAVVGVDDVADGMLLALEKGRRGRRYILTESNPTHLAVFRCVAAALGVAAPRRTAPTWLWPWIVGAVSLVDRLRPAELVTPQALRALGTSFRFDNSRAREELGWNPRPFPEVIEQAVHTLRARGDL
ncbi:MAG TPA: NAD-dependent epimerase/dehydratase family protein [Planctomycetota bacterium]|jgi:dihydroflavonol-4-reductase|nr:NAD-dependent epimerase/dehydratase family protein [Planctomycetota bacterium]